MFAYEDFNKFENESSQIVNPGHHMVFSGLALSGEFK